MSVNCGQKPIYATEPPPYQLRHCEGRKQQKNRIWLKMTENNYIPTVKVVAYLISSVGKSLLLLPHC
jgi:hypothetical protein